MDNKKREVWVDFVKILAIFLVVLLHTVCSGVDDNYLTSGLVFYFMGTFAIPLFFMVNGYLQLGKQRSYKYYCKKIAKILLIVFIWNIFMGGAKLILKQKADNLILESVKGFIQRGYFKQFWFLGALIILYLVAPGLSKIFNNDKRNDYKFVTILLVIICIIVDLWNIINNFMGNTINVIQTFKVWTWLDYFCIGGYISKTNLFTNLSKKKHFLLVVICVIFTLIYECSLALKLYNSLYAEKFYDSIIVIFTTSIIFTYIKKMNFKYEDKINTMGKLTMGIYILHPTIISITGKFIPMTNNYINLILAVGIFLISAVISYIIYKLPKVNSLIKL